MAHSYVGTTAIWKRPIRHHQPSVPAALCLLEASKAAGSLGWRSLISYIMLFSSTTSSRICIYAADTRNIRRLATLILLRISLQVYIIKIIQYMYSLCIDINTFVQVHSCACSHHDDCKMLHFMIMCKCTKLSHAYRIS